MSNEKNDGQTTANAAKADIKVGMEKTATSNHSSVIGHTNEPGASEGTRVGAGEIATHMIDAQKSGADKTIKGKGMAAVSHVADAPEAKNESAKFDADKTIKGKGMAAVSHVADAPEAKNESAKSGAEKTIKGKGMAAETHAADAPEAKTDSAKSGADKSQAIKKRSPLYSGEKAKSKSGRAESGTGKGQTSKGYATKAHAAKDLTAKGGAKLQCESVGLHATDLDVEKVLMEAAERLFMTKGLHGTRTDEIAKGANVSHSLVYYYFRTKRALYRHIVDNLCIKLIESIERNIATKEDDILHDVANLVSGQFDAFCANPSLARFVMNEFAGEENESNRLIRDTLHPLRKITDNLDRRLRDAWQSGKIAELDALDLLVDITALNATSVCTAGLLMAAGQTDFDRTMALRKRENIKTIVKRMLP